MASYPTPHIDAVPGDFGKTVLMPGDPLRSEFIAKNFLEDARLVNNVRGVQGYTGYFEGCRVSVMASGMGMPSIGIYSHELFNIFGVDNIIRVGSAGGYRPDIKMRDIIIGMGACTDSRYSDKFHVPGAFAPICSYHMLRTCTDLADEMKLSYRVGNLLSTDRFYNDDDPMPEDLSVLASWTRMGVMAVEMEAAALYTNAARYAKNALAICTISDHLMTGESLPASDRQTGFTDMIKLALRTAKEIENR